MQLVKQCRFCGTRKAQIERFDEENDIVFIWYYKYHAVYSLDATGALLDEVIGPAQAIHLFQSARDVAAPKNAIFQMGFSWSLTRYNKVLF